MTTLSDDVLLTALGTALAPEPVEPGPEALASLHRALEALEPESDDRHVVVPFLVPARRSSTMAGIHRLRHPVAALVAVGVLATSGVAAAGVATDHLPGPTRNVAYAIGLPVTSPGLEAAKGTLSQLSAALADHDAGRVRSTAPVLRTQLASLSPADRSRIQASADALLARADAFLATGSSGDPSASGSPGGSGTSGRTSGVPAPRPGSSTIGTNGSTTHGGSSGGTTTGTSNLPGGVPVDTRPGAGSPGTTRPGDGSGDDSGDGSGDGAAGGSSGGATTTTTTTTTGTTGTTTTTRPRGDDDGSGDGSDDGKNDGSDDGSGAKSATSTTRPGSTPD